MFTLGNLEIENEGNKPNKNNVKQFLEYALVKIEDIGIDAVVCGRVFSIYRKLF
jgi:hypothetical protein